MFGTHTSFKIAQIGFVTVSKSCRITVSNNGSTSRSCGVVPTIASEAENAASLYYTAPALVPFSGQDMILVGSISGVLIICQLAFGLLLVFNCK